MDIWVLGCGPSLAEVPIPPDVLTIGVNNSYKHHWSPVWAGGDFRALRRDYLEIEDADRPLIYFTSIDPKRVSVPDLPGRPLESILRPERPVMRKGGVFAYWVAVNIFKATRVHLIGFDMETNPKHFDDERLSDWSYIAQRFQMKEIQAAAGGVETWVYLKGEWCPLEVLPAKGVKIKGGHMYQATDRDITEGTVLPQNYDFAPYLDKMRTQGKLNNG